jgi:hypothetical protein
MVEWLYHVEEQHKALLTEEGERGDIARTLHAAHEGESHVRHCRRHELFAIGFLILLIVYLV